ncbi:STAS domain-containing protein [Amycolatopsis sp.]|uniref:STAS domain-containing protein n=1 Tax=Amycolatopsis sp. TaxID=37632 RepID=UPI002D806C66|nr:STAS domain-containing protein [Amycolatopsis sp.]HET6709467.1 STAS domain-containing protein [Amycolatopsis sp.]
MVPQPRPADHQLTAPGRPNAGGHMSLRVRRSGSRTLLVEVSGEVDLGTARRLDEALQDLVHSGIDDVVIDLSGVTFFSVAGLNSLLRAQLLADSAGARLTVESGRSRAVRRLFTLLPTDFDTVANVRPVS